MDSESLRFLLAFAGFAGLAAQAILMARGRFSRALAIGTALIVLVHVYGIWAHRYVWRFAEATRNGYGGFAAFHFAIVCVVVAAAAPRLWARRAAVTAFLVVALGANGAAWRYPEVAIYRFPLLALTLAGGGFLLWSLLRPPKMLAGESSDA